MTEHPDYRVGDEERQRAAALLEGHFRAGRLDSHEYEDRRGKALDAVTRSDLEALFADLPQEPGQPGADLASTGPRGHQKVRDTAMALLPFIALFLFLRTGEWLWLLIIPVGAILLRGPGGRPRRRDDRNDPSR
jgi:hypothetical protein